MNTKEHRNISPNLSRFMNQKKEQRKPSLGKSVPLGDLDILMNTKKSNISSDEDTSSDVSDNYHREEDEDEDEVSQMYSNKDEEDEEDDEDDGEEEISYNKDNNDYEEEEEEEEEVEELSYEQIQKSKAEFIYKLNRLDKLGYKSSRRYSMASNLEDLKFEYNTLNRQRSIEKSVKFSRKMLMAFVSGTEYLNHRFDYLGIKLDKWSENTMESIGDYDEVFEELHDKYNDSVKMAPELRLLMMVGGSALCLYDPVYI